MPAWPLLPAEQAWLVTLPARPLAAGAMDGERVYIPLGPREADGVPQPGTEQIVALDRHTGERRWSRDLRVPFPPASGEGRLFVTAPDGIHALDPRTGDDLWHSSTTGRVLAAPAVSGEMLLVVTDTEGLVALRARDGAVAWQHALGGVTDSAALTVAGEAVYLSLGGGRVLRASAHDGSPIWERTLPGSLGPPALARDHLLVGSTDNHLYALDVDDGGFEWRYPAGGDVLGAAAGGDDVFFVALDNVLRALRRGSGNQRWKVLLDTRASAPPRVVEDVVLVPGLSPALAAFDRRTGAPIGMYSAPSDLIGPALVDADLRPFQVAIVAITGDGRVAALRPVQMMFREPPAAPISELPGRRIDPGPVPLP